MNNIIQRMTLFWAKYLFQIRFSVYSILQYTASFSIVRTLTILAICQKHPHSKQGEKPVVVLSNFFFLQLFISAHLIHIDDHSEDVAETKDNDNPYQDHGNVVVPLLSAGGLLVQAGHVGDG